MECKTSADPKMAVLRTKVQGETLIKILKEYEVMDYSYHEVFEIVDRQKEAPIRLRRGPQQYSYFNPI